MNSFFKYIQKNKDVPFSKKEPNVVDELVVTAIIYLPLDKEFLTKHKTFTINEYLKEYLECENRRVRTFTPSLDFKFATAAYDSFRFGTLVCSDYIDIVSEKNKIQFSAMTICSKKLINIIFMGTDNSFVGWEENLTMSYNDQTPSQESAVKYVNYIAAKYPDKPIYISGHSKGGNLAMYGLTYCKKEVQERVIEAYNFDGPGLTASQVDTDQYRSIRKKITTYVPYYSFVGIIFEQSDSFKVIRASKLGLMQHAFYYWQVKNDDLRYFKRLSIFSRSLHNGINNFIEKMPLEERKVFVDKISTILNSTDAKDVSDILKNLPKFLMEANISFYSLDKKDRKIIRKSFRYYLKGLAKIPSLDKAIHEKKVIA